MKKIAFLLAGCLFSYFLPAQQYTDYLGAGHNIGITVTSSHNQNTNNDGGKSVDGFPVSNPELLADASRFLAQATLGYDFEMIQMTAAMGYEAWLDEQFKLPRQTVLEQMKAVANNDPEYDDEGFLLQGMNSFRGAWWENALKNPDLLRHKINYVLSQIFVISAFGSDLFEDFGQLSAAYYDVLATHSFGNYRNLLNDVSLNPSMGLYLNHMDNPKSDPANNIHPDENYAREVMQLFSIGLYELNQDGSRKLDANGNFIPSYNNNDIREFAKIFTGFSDGHPDGVWNDFGVVDVIQSAVIPMKMHEDLHEPGEKTLLNGLVVPAGQSGMQDFSDAMDNLYYHPNIGPFIGKALIQLLVSSNPSPAYIERVSNAFASNSSGIRGDMKAVIKAILLDPEARDCMPLENASGGKLREPIVRYSNFLQAFHAKPTGPTFKTIMDRWYKRTGQVPLFASSVFNFYQPEYQPNGSIANQGLVGPVFQIHNSSTAIGFVNEANSWTFKKLPMLFEEIIEAPEEEEANCILDFSTELTLAADAVELIDRLNLLLAAGQLSDRTKTIIINAVSQLSDPRERIDMALYLVMISPDYAVLK